MTQRSDTAPCFSPKRRTKSELVALGGVNLIGEGLGIDVAHHIKVVDFTRGGFVRVDLMVGSSGVGHSGSASVGE